MADEYKIKVGTTGDTAGADKVEKALKNLGKEGKAALKEIEKGSKALEKTLESAGKELDGTTGKMEAQLTAANQTAEIVAKLKGSLDALGASLRERDLVDMAEQVEFLGTALQRVGELAAGGLAFGILIKQAGGLTVAMKALTASTLAFVATPIGATLTAAAAAALALMKMLDGVTESAKKVEEIGSKPMFAGATASAEALAEAARETSRLIGDAVKGARNLADGLDAAARLQERLNRAEQGIDDLQTAGQLQEIDARDDLGPGAKAVARAEVENQARRRKQARLEAAEDAQIRAKEAEAEAAMARAEHLQELADAGPEASPELQEALAEASAEVTRKNRAIAKERAAGSDGSFSSSRKELEERAAAELAAAGAKMRVAQEAVRDDIASKTRDTGAAAAAERERADQIFAEAAGMRRRQSAAIGGERTAAGLERANASRGGRIALEADAAGVMAQATAQINEGIKTSGQGSESARVASELRELQAALSAARGSLGGSNDQLISAVRGLRQEVSDMQQAMANFRETGL